jgi:hypothetical protein
MKETGPSPAPPDSLGGGGFAFDMAIGGAPSPVLVIGGNFAFQQFSKPTLTINGRDFPTVNDMNVGVLGVLVEGFPSATSGFHYAGTIGLGRLSVTNGNTGSEVIATSGFGYGAAVGYDFKISPNWYIGVGGRLIGATTSYQGSDETTLAFAFLVDALDF